MNKKWWVVPLKHISHNDLPLAGGKGANLGEMLRNNFPVPNGFVVTSQAYFDYLEANNLNQKITKIIKEVNVADLTQLDQAAKQIQELILKTSLSQDLIQLILKEYHQLTHSLLSDPKVAVRSSATAEDLPDASFAGQQATYLNVQGEKELINAVQKCWASLFTPRAIYYRQVKGFSTKKVGIAAVVQLMVESRSSGVMFTIDPVTNDKTKIIVEAIFGLGEMIVQGSVTPDHFEIDKKSFQIVTKRKGNQDKKMVYKNKDNVVIPLNKKEQESWKISDEEAIKLAKIGRKLENHYLKPQDVEWSIDSDGHLFIVQTRPVTTMDEINKKLSQKANVIGDPDLKGAAASPGVAEGHAKIIATQKDAASFKEGEILVAKMTSPDLVPIMKKSAAILTQEGGLTSHAAIVSRELGKPCIVGINGLLDKVKNGQFLTVDANKGYIYFGEKNITHKANLYRQPREENLKTRTRIYTNLSDPDLAETIAKEDVDGVGLLRAEFMIINEFKVHPKKLISEGKSQYFIDKMAENLKRFAKAFYPRPVVYRATDFKTNEYRHLEGGQEYEPLEENPMIGYRGAFRYINDGAIFRLELQAIKKVRQEGLNNLHLMIPFVRRIEEVKTIQKIIAKEGLKNSNDFKLWVMVEVPSMVILIEELMESGIQGVSIGTNDLTMLTLGTDRDNHEVASIYSELDPAVLWSVERVIKAGKKHNVTVSVCGQAPSLYEEFTAKLIELGVTSVSVSPDRIQPTRQLVYQLEKKLNITNV